MKDYLNFFNNKKVTIMGLGLLGRGVGDAEFLAKRGADLIVTDLKTEKELSSSIDRLRKFKNIKFVLGEHRLEDFNNRDFILKAAGVPLDSPYIAEAKKNNIPIEMDASLFFKLAPKHNFIGVTGTRGKSTTTFLLYKILESAGKRVFMAGNIPGMATLPLLEKVEEGDYVVAELDSWQLQGFGDSQISPPYSIFTTFLPDHMNYYDGVMDTYFKDKENIFKFQKKENILVIGEGLEKIDKNMVPSTLVVAKREDLPRSLEINMPGEHNKLNVACAVTMARELGIKPRTIASAVRHFRGVVGRLQFVKVYNGVTIYNDNNATTPDATVAGLMAVSRNKNVVLIMGGSDKGLDMSGLAKEVSNFCKKIILIPGSGTEKFKEIIKDIEYVEADNLKDAINQALSFSVKDDIILFSPAFASFGMFKNEYDRGDQFMEEVSNLQR